MNLFVEVDWIHKLSKEFLLSLLLNGGEGKFKTRRKQSEIKLGISWQSELAAGVQGNVGVRLNDVCNDTAMTVSMALLEFIKSDISIADNSSTHLF